jgi:hypothetical protein
MALPCRRDHYNGEDLSAAGVERMPLYDASISSGDPTQNS